MALGLRAAGTRKLALYLSVVAAAAVFTVASLGVAVDQTARHVAQRSAEHPVTTRQPWQVPLPPLLAAADLHTVRLGPVVVAGGHEAAPTAMARSPAPPAPASVTVRVRAGAADRTRRVVAFAAGEPLRVAGGDRGWVEVVRHHGASGWVASRYLVREERRQAATVRHWQAEREGFGFAGVK